MKYLNCPKSKCLPNLNYVLSSSGYEISVFKFIALENKISVFVVSYIFLKLQKFVFYLTAFLFTLLFMWAARGGLTVFRIKAQRKYR